MSQDQVALKTIECLILAQAVWENGADAWLAVAKILSTHPLISRPKSFFTAQICRTMYQSLMKEAGLEIASACNATHSPINRKLAEKFYTARVAELRGLIAAEETKFKVVLSEIDAIRSIKYDAELNTETVGTSGPIPQSESSRVVEQISPDELSEGSDLTGVSVTQASTQSQDNLQMQRDSPIAMLNPPPLQVSDASGVVAATQTPSPLETVEGFTEHGSSAQLVNVSDEDDDVVEAMQAPPDQEHTFLLEDNKLANVIDVHQKRAEQRESIDESSPAEPNKVEQVVSQPRSPSEPSETLSLGEKRDVSQEPTSINHEVSPDSPAIPEVEAELVVDDGESSGEEPLHLTRRSTRRRESTIQHQQLQTRGKTLHSHAEASAGDSRELKQLEENEETTVMTPISALDHDDIARRWGGKRKASVIDSIDSPRERKRVRDDSEPAEEDDSVLNAQTRGRRPGTRSEEQVALKRFQNVIGMLHSQISQHRNGNIFHNPIKNSEAPDYHEIVKRPIDLKTIKMRVKDGSIANSLEYQRDIYLMFANAMMYNRPGSDVYSMAEDMMLESEAHILAFRQTEGLVRGVHR